MANGVFNIARGTVRQKVIGGSTFGVLLLKVVEADSTLNDRATVAAILAAANTEANFTNYARKTFTPTQSVDNTANSAAADFADQVWTSAGGATNNNLVKAVVYEDVGGSDATRIPLTYQDFVFTTNGTDLTGVVASAGFWGSA